MNSIERVKAALHFGGPDRVPVYRAGLGDVLPLVMLPPKRWRPGHAEDEEGLFPYIGDEQFVRLGLWKWQKPAWAKAPEYRKWMTLSRREIDEWGVTWKRDGKIATIGHPEKPALSDWESYGRYLGRYNPDPTDADRYRLFVRIARIFGRNRYRMGILGDLGPFSEAANIRGFNNFLIDHRKNPEQLRKLLSHLTDFYLKAMDMWVACGARPHGFILYDDLADQHRPFMSPALFAEFYEPVFRTLIDAAHSMGCEMHLHCCGKMDALIPIFIGWGLDALELDSPRMTGYADLALFRGRIMMWGCVNIQTIYPRGTAEECRREVWHMVRNLGTERGGFGAYLYPQPNHIGVPKQNIRAFERGLKEYGVYRDIPASWWDDPVTERWEDDLVPPLPRSEPVERRFSLPRK